jgi:hypothetical protein
MGSNVPGLDSAQSMTGALHPTKKTPSRRSCIGFFKLFSYLNKLGFLGLGFTSRMADCGQPLNSLGYICPVRTTYLLLEGVLAPELSLAHRCPSPSAFRPRGSLFLGPITIAPSLKDFCGPPCCPGWVYSMPTYSELTHLRT